LEKPDLQIIPVLKPSYLPKLAEFKGLLLRDIGTIFQECGLDPNKPFREQEPNPSPDRKKLDDIIFDILGLTKEERKEVYWAVCELVKARLDKAKSLKKSKD